MRVKALLALLGLCAGLAAPTQGAVPQDFDFTKFSGLWYEVAFTSKEGELGPPHKLEKMGGVLIKVEGNRISLSTTYFSEEGCVLEQVRAFPGNAPGKFKVIRKSGDKEIEILDTNYNSYAIMNISLHVAGEVRTMMKLYSRTPAHNKDSLSKFHEVAQERGFTGSDVHRFEQDCE
ncbi:epididymal-specific lipocalin-8 [Dipodomys spectabilis]|uniref:epididymal-specific lipocalin-8 n=1 Tax=Dipodomys spectabilis TaxID=105255 RepID=UPI001C5473DE|nr:epididymal-specific lipocalin-8 [Dipodomys spectabilis]